MRGPPPPPLSQKAFDKCIAEGKDPCEVDGLNAWLRSNERFQIAQIIAIGIGAIVMFGFLIVIVINS